MPSLGNKLHAALPRVGLSISSRTHPFQICRARTVPMSSATLVEHLEAYPAYRIQNDVMPSKTAIREAFEVAL